MTTPTKILFAVKNTDSRRHAAIDKAIRLAKALGAGIEFFHAISTPVFMEVGPLHGKSLGQLKREAMAIRTRQMEKLAARARRHKVPATFAVEWDYPPHEAIVRRVRRTKAGLVIAECHEGRRLAPWLVHLNDWELLRESPVPVLLLKNTRAWRRPTILAAVDPSHAHAKPSGLDEAVIDLARGFSRKLHGPLELMHANYPQIFGITAGDPAFDPAALAISYELQKARGRKAFEKFAERARIPARRCHLIDGEPADAITKTAKRTRASLVVMGAVSRSGLKRVFIGNTAERVLEELPCDVLVVKPRHVEHAVARKTRGVQIVTPAPMVPLPI